MDKVCDYCDCQYDDSLDNCPHCGAANDYVRRADGTPRTIEELKIWYASRNLPSENITRFFIGTDYRGAQAFGIYKDVNGDFVVYKNKSDGSRAIRYQGGDESYAVNELYCKLKEYIVQNKTRNSAPIMNTARKGKKNNKSGFSIKTVISLVILIASIVLILSAIASDHFGRSSGGNYGGYSYSDGAGYYDSDDDDDSGYKSSDNDDWDSDYDWDSGDSWDIGGGDWDSDW